MPASHQINDLNHLIITTWQGKADDHALIAELEEYQHSIKSEPGYSLYNEILDLSQAEDVKISMAGLEKLSKLAPRTDSQDVKTKLAIIVQSALVYGLARVYEVYRRHAPHSNKEIRIFKNKADALDWLNGSE